MRPHTHRERGAVLIVALLFLVMLTLLGVTAMTSTTMEERMAGNARDVSVAFQAAEAALRDARRDLSCYPLADCSAPHPARGLPANWPFDTFNFGNDLAPGSCNPAGAGQGLCLGNPHDGYGHNAQLPAMPAHSVASPPRVLYGTFTAAPAIPGVAEQPTYVIELFCMARHDESFGQHCNFFRITARGVGASPATVVTLQEIVAKDPI